MINFVNFKVNEVSRGIGADLVTDNEGVYFVSEEAFQERNVTPAVDEDGRNLVRVHVPGGGGLSLEALKIGEQNLGDFVFEEYPPKHLGIYAVSKDVSINFLSDFVNDMATGRQGCVGPAVLRELMPQGRN